VVGLTGDRGVPNLAKLLGKCFVKVWLGFNLRGFRLKLDFTAVNDINSIKQEATVTIASGFAIAC
jgi:hypothetical protein